MTASKNSPGSSLSAKCHDIPILEPYRDSLGHNRTVDHIIRPLRPPSTPAPALIRTRAQLNAPQTPNDIPSTPRTPLSHVDNREIHRNGYETPPEIRHIPHLLSIILVIPVSGHLQSVKRIIWQPALSGWTKIAVKAVLYQLEQKAAAIKIWEVPYVDSPFGRSERGYFTSYYTIYKLRVGWGVILRHIIDDENPFIALPATCPGLYRDALIMYAGFKKDYTLINVGSHRPELSTIIL
ncbi:hypothetical protein DFH09DRAFT_1084702 [Mycena vulgaris]|nr:hypothetical protein DFH09DRAFT_1084702 [Mycena vulgaris]